MTEAPGVYVVAGVGPGLGSALVATLASKGFETIGIARGVASLGSLEKIAPAKSWSFRAFGGDLTSQSEVDATFSKIRAEFGPLAGVVVSAGAWIVGSPLIHELDDAAWAEGIERNLTPVLRVSRAVIPSMLKEGKGSLVLVGAAERVRWAGTASYAAGKGAVIDLGRKMAHDYRSAGIRVNVVLPGNMSREIDPANPPIPKGGARLTDHAATSSWEVARTISHLLTHDGDWVTGAVVTVDGGWSTWAPEQP